MKGVCLMSACRRLIPWLLLGIFWCVPGSAQAGIFLSQGQIPFGELEGLCSSEDVVVNGTSITCRNGSFDIEQRTITADAPFNLIAASNIDVDESEIGNVANPISLTAQNGEITVEDSEVFGNLFANQDIDIQASRIVGDVESQNGEEVDVENSTIDGSVKSNGSIDVSDSYVSDDVMSQNGEIDIEDSAVGGSVTAPNRDIDIESSNVGGNVTSQNGELAIEDSTVGGSVTAQNREIEIESSTISGDVTTQNGSIDLESSTVLGQCSPGQAGCEGQNWPENQECSAAFPSEDGRNPNNRLDLSDAQFGVEPWPDSGTTLSGGTYRFQGDDLNQYTLNVASGESVLIFINGSVDFGNGSGLNVGGDPEDLVIVVNGEVDAKNKFTFSGILYSSGSISIQNGSDITGMLSAAGDISIDGGGRPSFDPRPDLAPGLSIEGVCGPSEGLDGVDHYRIYHPSQALTCTPADEIRVQACANSDCTELFDEAVTIELSPESGWSNNPLSFVGESNKLKLRSSQTEDPVQLGIAGASEIPTGTPQWRCYADGSSTQSNCQIQFSESGFSVNVDDHISGEEVTATIIAVKEGENDPNQCVPAFTGQKDVELSTIYQNPGPNTASGDHLIQRMDSGDQLDGSSQSLNFDSSGTAIFPIRYEDVGSLSLKAEYEGTGDEAGLLMEGQDDFVARPARFEVIVDGNPGALDLAEAGKFRIAGESFNVEVRSLNALGNLTPNFGKESPKENVVLDVEPPTDPDAAVPNLPNLGGPGLGDFDNSCDTPEGGKACGEFSWEEVGAFALMPTLDDEIDDVYLGTASVEGILLPYVGRFWPKYFDISIDDGVFSSKPLAPQARTICTEEGDRHWVYTGEPFGWKSAAQIIITPKNSRDDPVKNYSGTSFQLLEPTDVRSALGDFPVNEKVEKDAEGNLLKLHATLEEVNSFEEGNDGVLVYVFDAEDEFRYPKTLNARVDEYIPNPVFTLQKFEDSDGVTAQNPSSFFDKTFEPSADDDFKIRYGRIRLENAYGPENTALPIPLTAEVYRENGFERHEDESCWFYDLSENAELNFDDSDLNGSQTQVVEVSDVGLTLENGMAQTSPNDYRLRLSAPGVPEESDQKGVHVKLNVGNDWLKDFWDPDEPSALKDPSAWATFGVYRGNDRIIYWREVQ